MFFRKELPFAGYSVVKERRLRPSGSGVTSRDLRRPVDSVYVARQPKPAYASAPLAKAGGEYRARTGDLLVANQALSQLS